MRRLQVGPVLMSVTLLLGGAAWPCTTFLLSNDGAPIFGKNYDWDISRGLLETNPRGLHKNALTLDNPASWTSRYGSVTFNQYGREFPCGGMNEAGLVIEVMWLDGSEYPQPDARPCINIGQWVQYQLDTAASVQEVLDSDRKVRVGTIGDAGAPLHYLVADAQGDCAAVEFLGGKMCARHGDTLPERALTNDTYPDSLAAFKLDTAARAKKEWAKDSASSLRRFCAAAERARKFTPRPQEQAVKYAFDTLEAAFNPGWTVWAIVYDLRDRRIFYRTKDNATMRSIGLKDLDFACSAPALQVDLDAGKAGDILPAMKPWSTDVNRRLIQSVQAKTDFLTGLPPNVLEIFIQYPDSCVCEP